MLDLDSIRLFRPHGFCVVRVSPPVPIPMLMVMGLSHRSHRLIFFDTQISLALPSPCYLVHLSFPFASSHPNMICSSFSCALGTYTLLAPHFKMRVNVCSCFDRVVLQAKYASSNGVFCSSVFSHNVFHCVHLFIRVIVSYFSLTLLLSGFITHLKFSSACKILQVGLMHFPSDCYR